MRRLLRIAGWLTFLGTLAGAALIAWVVYPRQSFRALPTFVPLPRFVEVPCYYEHRWARGPTRPAVAAAAIDVDGDGSFEIFVGGGSGQDDALLGWVDGGFSDRIDGTGLAADAAAYGAASLDVDEDGDVDLFVARHDGIVLYRNAGERFSTERIEASLPSHHVPVSIALDDLDGDGDVDAYVAVMPDAERHEPYGYDTSPERANLFLRNDGGTFVADTPEELGRDHGTFAVALSDLDGDGSPEILLGEDGASPTLLHRDDGGYRAMPLIEGGRSTYRGVATGDVDNDGDQDVVLTNVGNSQPEVLSRGELPEGEAHTRGWYLLRNEGELRFEDHTASGNLGDVAFGRGAAFADVNLDGFLDLVVAQNDPDWVVHGILPMQGNVLLGVASGRPTFYPWATAANPWFAASPLLVDFDGDGRTDIVWINVDGPVRAFRNESDGHFVHVILPDTPNSLGARVTLEGERVVFTHEVRAGGGVGVDPPPEVTFGLGEETHPGRIVVRFRDGRRTVIGDVVHDTVVRVRGGG